MTQSRILIVDDSSLIRVQVGETLNEAGFEVIEAADGEEGVEAIDNDPTISMVICDIHMPRLGGNDLVERIKAQPRHANLPILMLTTDSQPSTIKRAKSAGARGFIIKPFEPRELLAVVRRFMEPPNPAP